jgi:hypothetical protein
MQTQPPQYPYGVEIKMKQRFPPGSGEDIDFLEFWLDSKAIYHPLAKSVSPRDVPDFSKWEMGTQMHYKCKGLDGMDYLNQTSRNSKDYLFWRQQKTKTNLGHGGWQNDLGHLLLDYGE